MSVRALCPPVVRLAGLDLATALTVETRHGPRRWWSRRMRHFWAGDGVLDTRSALAVSTPCSVAHDATGLEARRDELAHAPVATIGEHAAVPPGTAFRPVIVGNERSRCGCRGHHWQPRRSGVTAPDEDLDVARPPIVLRLRDRSVIARRDGVPSTIHARRRSRAIARSKSCEARCEVGDDAMDL